MADGDTNGKPLNVVGKPFRKVDARAKCVGQTKFADDIMLPRTLHWTKISQAVKALTPFADKTAAQKAGFDTSKPHKFQPFNPVLPERLGEFHSFHG